MRNECRNRSHFQFSDSLWSLLLLKSPWSPGGVGFQGLFTREDGDLMPTFALGDFNSQWNYTSCLVGRSRSKREGNQETVAKSQEPRPDGRRKEKRRRNTSRNVQCVAWRRSKTVSSVVVHSCLLHPASHYLHHFTHHGSCRITNVQDLSSAVLKAVLLRMGCWRVQHLCLSAFPKSQFIHSRATPKVAQEKEGNMLSGLGVWVRSCPLNLRG